MEHDILTQAKAYCVAQGWSQATLGRYATGDARLLSRIARGRSFPATIKKLIDYMRDNPPGAD